VSYYEPAGTDATIYEPSPDLKFVNDTGHHVLINSYVKGDEVVFEFWGTKDGRTVAPIVPHIYNTVAPPAMKLVETLDLAPGKKKCTESAHAGADAEFTYHVTYADGTEHSEVFSSHYRPWQAVCLVGVEKLSEPALSNGADAPVTATNPITAD
jgi:vancomycin resistance protein YoaR